MTRSRSSPKTPRIFTSIETGAMEPEAINQLFQRAGMPARDLDKLSTALQNSLFCVTARILSTRELVGFLRADGDGVFNVTLWDFVVDPQLANRDETKELLIDRLQREVQRSFSRCSVSILGQPKDLPLLRCANFNADQKGIRAMALRQNSLGYRLRQLRRLNFGN
ncbi:hypothetical protein [Prochlorothrix hollandica]|uniref:hypothetical protein n=1 Tax=Prochlorothrix hollandica TaxID=1223 RepID=UPI00034CD8BF|nr:hypothetical protein [Prochlorothrix hollandica]